MKERGTWEAPGEHVFSLALLSALVSKISKKQTLCSLLQQKTIKSLPLDSWSLLQKRNWPQASSVGVGITGSKEGREGQP